jgi:CheY-like chemotaxis protein
MPKRLLFVDDEAMVLDGLRRALHGMREGWEMRFVESGAAALEALEKERYDAVVSDMRMPMMDGAQLLEEVKQRYPDMVRMILSGAVEQGSGVPLDLARPPVSVEAMRSAGAGGATQPGVRDARSAFQSSFEDDHFAPAVDSEPADAV